MANTGMKAASDHSRTWIVSRRDCRKPAINSDPSCVPPSTPPLASYEVKSEQKAEFHFQVISLKKLGMNTLLRVVWFISLTLILSDAVSQTS